MGIKVKMLFNMQNQITEKKYKKNVIELVSDLRQVGGILRFPQPIKLTAMI